MCQKWDSITFEILLQLLKSEAHVRQLSTDLKIPLSTLSRKLTSLRDGLILDYKVEGKNYVFFIRKNLIALKAVLSAENYKLMKTAAKNTFLLPIFEDLAKIDGMIILFGSYAKGTAKEDSDIDIYIETTEKAIKERAERVYHGLSVKIGAFNKNDLLMREIIKNHVIIKRAEEYYEKLGFLA